MMPVVRVGDINSGGGAVIQGHLNVIVNSIPMAQFMSPVTPHPPCPLVPIHCGAVAAFPGSSKVTANGKRVLRVGDFDTCFHPRMTGSRNVVCG